MTIHVHKRNRMFCSGADYSRPVGAPLPPNPHAAWNDGERFEIPPIGTAGQFRLWFSGIVLPNVCFDSGTIGHRDFGALPLGFWIGGLTSGVDREFPMNLSLACETVRYANDTCGGPPVEISDRFRIRYTSGSSVATLSFLNPGGTTRLIFNASGLVAGIAGPNNAGGWAGTTGGTAMVEAANLPLTSGIKRRLHLIGRLR